MQRLFQFLRRTEAATAVEYAVMLAMILLAMLGTILILGGQTGTLWGNSKDKLDAAGFGS